MAEEAADGQVQWALSDNQGTVRDIVDDQGQVLNHISHDSFGNVTGQSNPEAYFRFGYTGREFDQKTRQYYYRARYFDSGIGQFISEDPVRFNAGDINLYRYVFNSPTNFTDPSGNVAIVLAPAAPYILAAAGAVIVTTAVVAKPLVKEAAERVSDAIPDLEIHDTSQPQPGPSKPKPETPKVPYRPDSNPNTGTDSQADTSGDGNCSPELPKKRKRCEFIQEFPGKPNSAFKTCAYNCKGYGALATFPWPKDLPCPDSFDGNFPNIPEGYPDPNVSGS